MDEWRIPSLWHTDLPLPAGANKHRSMPAITPDWECAFHEAGHAVACYRLFHRLEYVSIVNTDEYRGCMKGVDEDWYEREPGTPEKEQRAHIAKLCTITLAGGAAVEKLLGTMDGVEMTLDIGAVQDLLEGVAETGQDMDLFTDRCWDQARRLVRKEWEGIKAVAAALMDRKTLSGEDVGDIVERVGSGKSGK